MAVPRTVGGEGIGCELDGLLLREAVRFEECFHRLPPPADTSARAEPADCVAADGLGPVRHGVTEVLKFGLGKRALGLVAGLAAEGEIPPEKTAAPADRVSVV